MNRRVHLQALACLGLFLFLVATLNPLNGGPAESWVDAEKARLSAQLQKVDPHSARATKLQTKIARLDAYEAGRPQPGFPDEYARFLREIKIPSDREAPEYAAGYQIRELEQAQLAKRAGTPLPWESRGPGNVAGRARGIIVDPDDPTGSTWFIASVGGGIWKTEDKGATWRELTDEVSTLSIQSIAMSPANTDVIYAGTGESFFNVDTLNGNGILKSTDKGETWTLLPSTANDPRLNNVSRIIVDPADENVVLASATVGAYKLQLEDTSNIFRSTDGGATWTVVHTETGANSFAGPRILQLVADPTDFDVQYATVYAKGILKSTDGGLSWNYVNNGITDFTGRFEMAISPVNSNYLYASAMGASHSELWISLDGGANWFETFETGGNEPNWLGAQGWYDNTIVCHPTDPTKVFVGGLELWSIRTAGLGSSTRATTRLASYSYPHPDHHGLEIVQPSGGDWFLLGTNDGGIARTASGNSNFTDPDIGMVTSQFYGVDKRPGASAYVGGMQDNGTWRSPVDPDETSLWVPQIGGDGYETSWHFDDPQKLIGGSQFNGLARSLDGGISWETATNGLADTGGGAAPFITKIGKSIQRPDQIFAVGAQGVWRSDDFGGSWSLTAIDPADWGGISSFHDVRVSKADPDIVWAGSRMDGSGNIMLSTDAGASFNATTQYTGATLGRISGMATHPSDPDIAYVLFSFAERPKVLKTTDRGNTWTDISGFAGGSGTSSNGFPDVAVYDLVVFPNDENKIWVGSEIGIIESLDGGATWALADNGLPAVGIWWLNVIEDEVVVATHGRGIWTVTDPAFEDGQTFNPLLDFAAQGSDGFLTVQANLRSEYDSSEVVVSGMGTVATFGANQRRQIEVVQVPVMSAGTLDVFVRGTKGGQVYQSVTRSVEVVPLAAPTFAYSTTVDDGSDFILDGLSVSTAAGFSDPALQTPHNYPNDLAGSALLTTPIQVGVNSTLSYDEIAIIEPGDAGTVYGDFAFWDYAIVEGSIDGVNWSPLVPGYDAREDNVWLNAYNTQSPGDPSMVRTRTISLTDTFDVGDTILVRFRFFADSFVVGWGWWVDNIVVDPGAFTAADVPQRLALEQNVPNPFNPKTTISFNLPVRGEVSLRVFDVRGRLVTTLVEEVREAGRHSVVWDGTDRSGVRAASGVYFYRLTTPEQTLQQKMTLVK